MNLIDTARQSAAKPLPAEDFLTLGIQHLAYMKPTVHEGRVMLAVHAADGSPITYLPDNIPVAIATIKQNDLIPVSVH